jgi:Protein of unknown function (DUF2795)
MPKNKHATKHFHESGHLIIRSLGPRTGYYLRGIESFPAQKEEVASTAESNGAPQDVVEQIRNADTERFNSPEEVMQTLQQG